MRYVDHETVSAGRVPEDTERYWEHAREGLEQNVSLDDRSVALRKYCVKVT
jgi:hypothetical protein